MVLLLGAKTLELTVNKITTVSIPLRNKDIIIIKYMGEKFNHYPSNDRSAKLFKNGTTNL